MAPGTKRIPRAIREQQMLDAAIGVFADLGYRSSSMDAIARAASISKPMLYLYYGSKEELFAACVTRESGHLIDHLNRAAAGHDRPRERLRSVIAAFLGFVDEHSASWAVVYRQAVAEPGFRAEVERTRAVLVEMTTDLLEASARGEVARAQLEVVAVALVGAGEAVADRVSLGRIDREEAAGVVTDLAWQGLSGGGPGGDPPH